ncbi:DUF1674 domain-containing protein [Sinorhizobium meliloti]|jgi:hypothetical protein|uniref:DUF1674 domain-containing protein n=1 Tax=Rhizobium meliloti TaxID=382 RepID=UPI00040A8611|nr:DUF1674 domain-containing protein [Sinorhizobium meliloti]MCM5687324.1 DUF1674 domain-containing protein [Sinorhizobium meliloti]MDE3826937.1 DUF1674 domain-containing protein [Sinorhizobium meliloti]WQP07087.1 DUF1674 domain-containing protein [Sinorhizobium meliloti]WQP20483.1 DUF1674 domain-containing protein [Sinorhizobium meliloti]WQP33898.1 DUF1674 domain-containing protein [Sinorhizobium meliloti]
MMGINGQLFNIVTETATGMQNDNDNSPDRPRRPLSPAALRALKEAEERRRAEAPKDMPAELGGRGGLDPARFGDWEIKGRAIDF